jgi:hypothetical protein
MVEKPVCGICGASIPVDVDFCPVCALRGALQANEPPSELLVNRTSEGEKLLTDFGSSLSTAQAEYIDTSIAEQKRRQRIREQCYWGSG